MASTFPIADRYFCSAMAQTDPNRRYLIAGTSLGLIDDTFPSELPPNGVIFQQFNKHGITWKDYYSTLPTLGVFLPLLEATRRSAAVWPRSISSTPMPRPEPSLRSASSSRTTTTSPKRIPRTSSSATSSWARSSTP